MATYPCGSEKVQYISYCPSHSARKPWRVCVPFLVRVFWTFPTISSFLCPFVQAPNKKWSEPDLESAKQRLTWIYRARFFFLLLGTLSSLFWLLLLDRSTIPWPSLRRHRNLGFCPSQGSSSRSLRILQAWSSFYSFFLDLPIFIQVLRLLHSAGEGRLLNSNHLFDPSIFSDLTGLYSPPCSPFTPPGTPPAGEGRFSFEFPPPLRSTLLIWQAPWRWLCLKAPSIQTSIRLDYLFCLDRSSWRLFLCLLRFPAFASGCVKINVSKFVLHFCKIMVGARAVWSQIAGFIGQMPQELWDVCCGGCHLASDLLWDDYLWLYHIDV